jgi:hypothetical protein
MRRGFASSRAHRNGPTNIFAAPGLRLAADDHAVEAVLTDGPLKGTKVEVDPVEGRPPSTVDVPDADGRTQRYCLAEWAQTGMSAEYSYLYPV